MKSKKPEWQTEKDFTVGTLTSMASHLSVISTNMRNLNTIMEPSTYGIVLEELSQDELFSIFHSGLALEVNLWESEKEDLGIDFSYIRDLVKKKADTLLNSETKETLRQTSQI